MDASKIRFGIIADIHCDFMYQSEARLGEFIEHMNREQVDFIIQLGDFCYPLPENRSFVEVWERFSGPKYHVLGNHDMDKCNKQTIMNYLGIERSYYSFDCGDYHFVVLDANHLNVEGQYLDYEFGNYHKHPQSISNLTPEQLKWLRDDLEGTNKTTIIFSHQNLESPYNDFNYGLSDSEDFLHIIRECNRSAGYPKVIACMNGHNHLDGVKVIDDVYFIHINSSSYFYMGKQYDPLTSPEHLAAHYPILVNSAPYAEPLYAIITLDNGQLGIQGKQSSFVGVPPVERGHKNTYGGHVVTAKISDRRLKF